MLALVQLPDTLLKSCVEMGKLSEFVIDKLLAGHLSLPVLTGGCSRMQF
jgi:hypothetical protein